MKKMRKQRLLIAVSAFLFVAAGCGQKAEEIQEIPQEAAASEEYSYKEQVRPYWKRVMISRWNSLLDFIVIFMTRQQRRERLELRK